MLVWILVIVVTVIACGALFYAGRGDAVNSRASDAGDAERLHHKALLAEIARAEADGKLAAADAVTARAELAREILSRKPETTAEPPARPFSPRLAGVAVALVAAFAIGAYGLLGTPALPGAPLAGRSDPNAVPPEVVAAIAKVEAQLLKTPEDVRGWQVLAPVYLRAGRFADAVNAYRRIVALAGETADAQTDLAEALAYANGGTAPPEALSLLEKAAAADPGHVRSRFLLAGDALARGDFERAKALWSEIVGLAKGTEAWLPAAREGLAMAEAGASTGGDQIARNDMIAGMVEGLAARLAGEGGTLAEWTRLVRAYSVLGDRDKAQKAYDDARAAYPDTTSRGELDALAGANGLE